MAHRDTFTETSFRRLTSTPSYAGQSLEVVALRTRERGGSEFTIRATFAINDALTVRNMTAAVQELQPLFPDHELDLVEVSLA